MNFEPTEEHFRQIASQLSHPTGEDGIKTADQMYISNMGMINHTIDALALITHDTVLELGHGNGKHIDQILSKADEIVYYGLEISELMNTEASKSNAEVNAIFALYDGNNIPYEDDYFTKILTVNTLYFWKDPIYLLNEIYRVLKPGGKFCCTFAQKDFMEKLPFTKFIFELYDRTKVEELIKAAPFKSATFEEHIEQLAGKDGQSIERNYTILSLVK